MNQPRAAFPAQSQTTSPDVVSELWSACHVLRDDGLGSHDYLRELTYLLFLKLLEEVGEDHLVPEECRWRPLVQHPEQGRLERYRSVLETLGSTVDSSRIRTIYAGATSQIRSDSALQYLVARLDRFTWHDPQSERLGDAYEGLLDRAASERKSGAGQYFTPRPLVETIVSLLAPGPGETVLDPACGTAGFLVTASSTTNPVGRLVGVELVHDVARLALMNLAVHELDGDIIVADSLYDPGIEIPHADVILSNPPFGTRGTPELRQSTRVAIPTRNKQLAFLQLIVDRLRPGGRAAVVVPDNVLFEDGVGRAVREYLVDQCELHTILRLPPGIFYAAGVKTNVLFFNRRTDADSASDEDLVWVYDARTDRPIHGKRQPLTDETFAHFALVFGDAPDGTAPRTDEGPGGRFRPFVLGELRANGLRLDVSWQAPAQQRSDLESLTADLGLALRAAIDALADFEAELEA